MAGKPQAHPDCVEPENRHSGRRSQTRRFRAFGPTLSYKSVSEPKRAVCRPAVLSFRNLKTEREFGLSSSVTERGDGDSLVDVEEEDEFLGFVSAEPRQFVEVLELSSAIHEDFGHIFADVGFQDVSGRPVRIPDAVLKDRTGYVGVFLNAAQRFDCKGVWGFAHSLGQIERHIDLHHLASGGEHEFFDAEFAGLDVFSASGNEFVSAYDLRGHGVGEIEAVDRISRHGEAEHSVSDSDEI